MKKNQIRNSREKFAVSSNSDEIDPLFIELCKIQSLQLLRLLNNKKGSGKAFFIIDDIEREDEKGINH